MNNLKPFFTFYGGKWRAAPKYPRPAHETIIEPFAGSAGYSLRYADSEITLVEKDPYVAATWRYLINVAPDEIMQLPIIKPGQSIDEFDLTQDQRNLLGWWMNPGSAQPKKTRTKFRGAWNERYRERIATQVEAIRHWKIIQGDYSTAPDIVATWFIDPPYIGQGKYYRLDSSKLDFSSLGEWCKSRSGQVIVCENDGADWLPFTHWRDIQGNQSGNGVRTSKETIWYKHE